MTRADDEPQDERNALQYRVGAVRQVAAGIAHEFANALTAIGGVAHLMRDEQTLDQQGQDDLDEIERITQQAAFLARELMAFASGRPAAPSRRWLGELIRQLRRLLPHVLPSNIRVAERLAANDVEVLADPQQITEIAIVLAVHARDRMPRGGELLVQTGQENVEAFAATRLATRGGRYAALTITSSGTVPGTAQGSAAMTDALADAARILDDAGAALAIHDDPGGTRTFTIYLPVAAENSSRPVPAPAGAGTETILLLEDDVELADVVARVLQVRGYSVLHASDGDAALELAKTFDGAIHLLLSDVVVPGASGVDLLRRFASIRGDARVLFMSGYAHGIGEGVPFIAKPFAADALSQKVREVLDAPSR